MEHEIAFGYSVLIAALPSVFMIVDEVQTGVGATGHFWAHQAWKLDSPPDFVTFRLVRGFCSIVWHALTRFPLTARRCRPLVSTTRPRPGLRCRIASKCLVLSGAVPGPLGSSARQLTTTPPDSQLQHLGELAHRLSLARSTPTCRPNSFDSPQMGDPIRALQAREMIKVIKDNDLVASTAAVGAHLYDSLLHLAKTAPGGSKGIQSLRGKDCGTFIAWDCETPAMRDSFVAKMREKGVNMGGCGDRAVRLRPMLTFERKHADIFLGAVEATLKEL